MITTPDVVTMIEHWLNTDANGYFGSPYGANKSKLLMTPLSSPVADEFIAKLKNDIPLLTQFTSNQLQIAAETEGYTVRNIYILLGNIKISVGQPTNPISPNAEVSNAFAL